MRVRFSALHHIFIVSLVVLCTQAEAKKKDKISVDHLPPQYQEWLYYVEPIISKEEKVLFVELEKDYQREAFIERFWRARDPFPRSPRNEYRDEYLARIEFAKATFHATNDERRRVLLLQGFPIERIETSCHKTLVPTEVWYYQGSDQVGYEFLLLFYQRFGDTGFLLWQPFDGLQELATYAATSDGRAITIQNILDRCGDEGRALAAAIGFLRSQGGDMGAAAFLGRLNKRPEPPDDEWVSTFSTYSTELDEGDVLFDASLSITFPGRDLNRTVVQGTLEVPTATLGTSEIGGHGAYNLMLAGEILREGKLFENFRYKFDFPLSELPNQQIPIVFQRSLRPGPFSMIVKLEDINSGKKHRSQVEIEVPKLEGPPPVPVDSETARILAEANAVMRNGETSLQIAPLHGQWQTGLVRIFATSTGNAIDKVTFFLDNEAILTKKDPPYSVELDLGDVPRARLLRVSGYDEAGEIVADDEALINSGTHRFAIRLVEPRRGKSYFASLRAEADVDVPEGELVERVEFFLNETLLATVYHPPYVQPIILPASESLAYVRAVAHTADGLSTEDIVFVNAPDYLEEIDVDFVELYTAVLDKDDRPINDLVESDFKVLEDGIPQTLTRFEKVQNLPVYAAVMLDTSASMIDEIGAAQTAALRFFEQAITPKDRATIVTFNDHPLLSSKFTNNIETLAGGLAGLKAERGTALYDSLIFTLYYFNGIKGQRAILILSDGKDESSRFEFDDALEFAERAGVSIYSIGLKIPRKEIDARRKLSKLAAVTGGRSFFVEDVSGLSAIYDSIQAELRSKYLLAYQSSSSSDRKDFRTIDVELARPGLEAKTLRGYYP